MNFSGELLDELLIFNQSAGVAELAESTVVMHNKNKGSSFFTLAEN